jgi:hypothetical protein
MTSVVAAPTGKVAFVWMRQNRTAGIGTSGFGGALAPRQAEVDDLFLAVGPQAEGHQNGTLERPGAGLAGKHDAVEHQCLVAVFERTPVEGRNRLIERLGHLADGRGADLLAGWQRASRRPSWSTGREQSRPTSPGRSQPPAGRRRIDTHSDAAEIAARKSPGGFDCMFKPVDSGGDALDEMASGLSQAGTAVMANK